MKMHSPYLGRCVAFASAFLGLCLWARAQNSVTVTAATGFYNHALSSAQNGTFTAVFDASASVSPSNSLVGLSQGSASAYTGIAVALRFNPSGDIDARDGGAYAALSTIPFTAGAPYHFRVVINVPAHTYSAYVTPPGGSELTIGTNYAFRTEQAGVTQLDTWNADVNATPGGSLTISNFTAPVAVPTFTIAASAGSNGTITPSGNVTVNQGANQTFTIAPAGGYQVASVTVDGASVGAVTSYTFSNVQANHTIGATFSVSNSATITAATGFYNHALSSAQNGTFTTTFDASASVSPSNSVIGLSQGSVSAYTGIAVAVRFNPSGDIDARNGGTYAALSTIPFAANATYHFRVVIDVPAHTYSAYVTPPGGSELTIGANYAFRTEQAGVTQLDTWNADVNSTPGGSLTIGNFIAPVAAPTFTITASAGSNGTISPSGSVTVSQGANQSFTIAANSGYLISNVVVDGASAGAVSSYTFSNVQASHSISATFVAIPTYTITASAGTGGTISPSGTVTLNQGANQAFTIAANAGYSITAVTVDGANVGAVANYTFTNIQANHTITASFSPLPAAPTFSPAPGTYTSSQLVSIGDSTNGVTIYYTTDGTTPTTGSTTYTGPVSISSTTTLEAIAVNSAGSSPVTSGTYTIQVPAGFIHPGVSVNKAQLDLIKSRVAQGIEPQLSAYNAAVASSYGSLTYTPNPWQTVDCGSGSIPDNGCSDEKNDSAAAYTQALLWYISGNTTYANNAIKIMNAWAQTLTGGHTNSNAELQAGWCGSIWPRAAEIILYTYNGWAPSDVAAFKNMLITQYRPYVINGDCANNGNWEASMDEAVINMAVFLDSQSDFQQGLTLWRGRCPAYFYLTTDGSSPIAPDGGACGTHSWYTTQPLLNGQCQETCRDMSHAQYGFAALLEAAETARQQGVDLFGEQAIRITTTMEFHTNYLNGASVPSSLCGGSLSINSYHPTWIIAYNHYHNVLGYNLPNTQKANASSATTGVDHHMVWEKLTHGDVGGIGLPPITQP